MTFLKNLPFLTLPTTRNIYGIGRNYQEHARELGNEIPSTEPVLFLKAASSIRGFEGPKPLEYQMGMHFEAEIVLGILNVIPQGTRGDWGLVGGLALGLDLTLRAKQEELKKKQLPWTLAKSFAGASVVSPFIPRSAFAELDALHFRFELEGSQRQVGDSRKMIFSVPEILTFILKQNQLEPGDIIFTGTPEGVAPIEPGQKFGLSWCEQNGSKLLAFKGEI